VRGVGRGDAILAIGFALAAAVEAAARYADAPGLLFFEMSAALWLGFLAVRRRRPLLALAAITIGGLLGALVTAAVWPAAADDGGGVWILAMMVASYSLGAHGSGRLVALGVVLPLLVVLAVDLTSRTGWSLLSGVAFVNVVIGLLPTAVGRLVRIRHDRLQTLRDQHDRIVLAQRTEQESAVLAERLQAVERLQPTLLEGLRSIASAAESSGTPAEIERAARDLLTRTREEVVALTAPVAEPAPADVPDVDHLAVLRATAQPWVVLGAGALATGLWAETSRVLDLSAPGWAVLPASLLVGLPLALAWRWPAASVAVAWVAAATYSQLIAPLAGSLSGAGFALAATFAVAALSNRRVALAALALCLFGQLVGVGAADPIGEAILLSLAWLGGLAVNEVSQLVEQTRANNALLAAQEAAALSGAVVEERLRLARELHDVLGHSLTVVALQAGAARRLADTDPARARDVMRTVAAAARSGVGSLALAEAPVDGADLAALVERVRATGVAMDADLADAVMLDPGHHAIAYRVVQEALTNVLRHAPGSAASVVVRGRGSRVEVIVTNSPPARAGSMPGTGRGLAGIEARVAAGGGQVAWRPRDDGGFEVRAVLPAARVPQEAP
jgi:signal transduction histidine kinase